jgi:hypothetical protein
VIGRLWARTPSGRAVEALRADVRRLTAAVERLEAVQRKDAEQLKRLRKAITTAQAAAKQTDGVLASMAADVRHARERLTEGEKDRRRAFERVEEGRRADGKWRKIFSKQIASLVRHVCLPLERIDPPYALNARRFRLRSQNEEDGLLLAIFDRAGWGSRRFVEIGSGSSGGNAAVLAHECGWSGLMVDLVAANIADARKRFAGNRQLAFLAAEVTPDNINDLLAHHGYAGEVDLLSIDIDSYDYWVLDALTVTSPRVLVLEYNALFGPERRVTIPLGQPLDATPKGYNGASLAALTALAGRKGYRLVACENAGVNAFYLRADVATEIPGVTLGEAFKPLRSRLDVDDAEVTTDIYAACAAHSLPLIDV